MPTKTYKISSVNNNKNFIDNDKTRNSKRRAKSL